MSASFTAPSPMVRRPVNPVLTPRMMRSGASLFSEAKAVAATGAIRLDGISTPVPSLMRDVFIAAAAIGDERVRAQHLGVEEPGVAETEFLRAPDQASGIGRGWNGDTELHGRFVRVWPVMMAPA